MHWRGVLFHTTQKQCNNNDNNTVTCANNNLHWRGVSYNPAIITIITIAFVMRKYIASFHTTQ